ncbi:hypothetical protein MMC18_007830 [Xylographa bjoerkii]|nr:hypothetical protein [Xylographa bjoerkii]
MHRTTRTTPHEPQLMIRLKKALSPKFRRLNYTWTSNSGEPFRTVESESSLVRLAGLKDTPRSLRRSRKRTTVDDEIFGLLQEIQADVFDSVSNPSAESSHNGTTNGSSRLSALEGLPLSPLMDPQLLAARRRYTDPKPQPVKEFPEIQTLLEKNPYARILASPVRACILTGVRLPCELLLPFTIQNHPQTRKPWLVPKGPGYLALPSATPETTSPPTPSPGLNADKSAQPGLHPPTAVSLSPTTLVRSVPKCVIPSPTPNPLPSCHSTAYLTTQLSALEHIAALKPRSLHRHLPFRWKTHFGPSLQNTVCRDDLPDFVLSLLRKRLIERLLALSDEDVPYLVSFSQGADGSLHQLGAGLWVGNPASIADGQAIYERKLEAFIAAQVKRDAKVVPLYNLSTLLGIDGVRELWASNGRFCWRWQEMVGVKAKRRTFALLGEMWRLMGLVGGNGA